ncbi:hypothetical protein D3C76_1533780 [compost metagenome]
MFMELFRRKAFAASHIWVKFIFHTEGYQLCFVTNKDFFERMLFHVINLEYHIAEQRIGMHILHVLLRLLRRAGYRTINTFRCN